MVTLQPIDYYNGGHKDYDGVCCDNLGSWWCFNECENWFQFCITTFPVKDWSKCQVFKATYVLGDDDFTLPGYGHKLGSNFYNPIRWTAVDRWQVICNFSSVCSGIIRGRVDA